VASAPGQQTVPQRWGSARQLASERLRSRAETTTPHPKTRSYLFRRQRMVFQVGYRLNVFIVPFEDDPVQRWLLRSEGAGEPIIETVLYRVASEH
jgi:hypothetical protein